MKVLIYDNKEKDSGGIYINALKSELEKYNASFKVLRDEEMCSDEYADALFVLGGDGTMLFVAEFAARNNIPVIGVNVGKLGFLCEFERDSISDAVNSLVRGELKPVKRLMLKAEFANKTYYALNEILIQRSYNKTIGNMVTALRVEIDGQTASEFKGDGVIVSSPAGSTAYSLSLGGPIVTPNASVFLIVPIAPHSFFQRPIVFSSESDCCIKTFGKTGARIFVDGNLIGNMQDGDKVNIKRSEYEATFLVRNQSDFFKKLTKKISKASEE